MAERSRRRELRDTYKQDRPEAGVYRFVNAANGKSLIGSSANIPSVRSKLAFARSTNSAGVFDWPLRRDAEKTGIAAISLEILELLEVTPEMTDAAIKADLATLEALWREKFDPALLY